MEQTSADTRTASPRVRMIHERDSNPPSSSPQAGPGWSHGGMAPQPETTPRATAVPHSTASDPAFLGQMTAALTAIGLLLAARMILLLSVTGGIALAVLAMQEPNNLKVATLAVYGILVILPLTWLYLRRG